MRITDSYLELNRQLHETRQDYGAGGHKWADAVLQLTTTADSILDYGSGKGTLKAALEGRRTVIEYDPAIPGKDAGPDSVDVVVCTDVLEHVEPDCLDDVLDHILSLARKGVFLNVATRPAVKTLADGRNAHLIVQNFNWWYPRIAKRFVVNDAMVGEGDFYLVCVPRKEPLKVFIGYDERQPAAFSVASQSLIKHASQPVSIHPLVLQTLPIVRRGLTPFTFSRFLVPWLCGYEGTAVFVDTDVLFRGDIHRLMRHYNGEQVSVVMHDHQFERPSLMVFNNAKCRVLTPEFVEWARGILLLEWATEVGSLPHDWNHLVGYDEPQPGAQMVHFTQGLPCYPETMKDEHGEEWRKMAEWSVSALPWTELMGASVHARHVRARNAA